LDKSYYVMNLVQHWHTREHLVRMELLSGCVTEDRSAVKSFLMEYVTIVLVQWYAHQHINVAFLITLTCAISTVIWKINSIGGS